MASCLCSHMCTCLQDHRDLVGSLRISQALDPSLTPLTPAPTTRPGFNSAEKYSGRKHNLQYFSAGSASQTSPLCSPVNSCAKAGRSGRSCLFKQKRCQTCSHGLNRQVRREQKERGKKGDRRARTASS